MNRWTGLALMLVVAALFLVANRGAYNGYFSDDELDNISWAPAVPVSVFAEALVSPRFQPGNFRPVGHLYFHLAGKAFGLDFRKYVFPIHAIHLLNVWLLWMLIRRMGGTPFAAGAGSVLFAFHMAVFDVYWKPMYVFDLLCATFCLAALLLWTQGRWLLAFAAFWLAYKSKELAVMLPFVLAAYEYWLGKRQWKPLLPFAAVSLSFGLQGLLLNPHRTGDYAFKLKAGDLARSAAYYRDRILMVPFGGLVLPALPAVVRDRRVWFGVAALLLFFVPLLPLSGRLFGAYCYVPLIGAAIALSGIADRGHRLFVTIFLLAWIPFNFMHLRLNRRQALAIADENRTYVAGIARFARKAPDMRQFIYDGRPFALAPWGIQGALRTIYRTGAIEVAAMDSKEAHAALADGSPLAILGWDPGQRRLTVTARETGTPDAAYIRMDPGTPIWQLERGWFALEGGYRWTAPLATARLRRPAAARRFEVIVNVSQDQVRDAGGTGIRVVLDGQALPAREFTAAGWQTARWELPPGPAKQVAVSLETKPYRPSNQDPRLLGVAVAGFGFVE
ncbi:MAG TPA: hypothetical protein VN442_06150 [Bryobacteraceae bacterium]|nr:hypothetical protein [Bryobacteraceae bacterium]